jgi:rod shape-determining protein MreD
MIVIRTIIWTVLFCTIAGILQSTVLSKIAIYGAVPDFALCVVIFSAYTNGTMTGQISGFFSGLLLDFMSSAPLGLNCLIRTLTGAITGLFKGAFFLDVFFLPVILCALGTFFKAFLFFILHLILGAAVPSYTLFAPLFWVELGLNSLIAPLLFLLLKKVVFLTNTWS